MTISLASRTTARIDATSSGSEVPKATMTTPTTKELSPAARPTVSAAAVKWSAPRIKSARLATRANGQKTVGCAAASAASGAGRGDISMAPRHNRSRAPRPAALDR